MWPSGGKNTADTSTTLNESRFDILMYTFKCDLKIYAHAYKTTTAVIMSHYTLCFAVYSVSQVWITVSSE